MAAGIVGAIASTVMACRATLQLDKVLEQHNAETKRIHDAVEDKTLVEYTEKNAGHDITVTYIKTGINLIRLYAPAVVVGTFSLGAIVTSNNILKRRNIALAAAYKAIDEGFKKYRDAVIERFGESVDHELRTGVHKLEGKRTTEEDGKKKKVKDEINILPSNAGALSDYAVVFDQENPNFDRNVEYNKFFLQRQQSWANDTLKSRGYLYLNEVYKELGFKPTKAGQVVGWVFDPCNEQSRGDNYVDLGVKMVYPEITLDPDQPAPDLDEYENPVFIIDPNVDGNIWDLM